MLSVGLTGGIASGKSRILARWRQHGFETLDLDAVARRVVEPGAPAFDRVVAEFGADVVGREGTIDRARLGSIVFADASRRRRLNAIVHPVIRAEEERVRAASRASVFVTDGALLVESGFHLRFDRVVTTSIPAELQLRRLMERDGLVADAAQRRLSAQLSDGERRRFAHLVVGTGGTLDDTDRAADEVAAELARCADANVSAIEPHADRVAGWLHAAPAIGRASLAECAREVARAGAVDLTAWARLTRGTEPESWMASTGEAVPEASSAAVAGLSALATAHGRGDDEPAVLLAAYSAARVVTVDRDAAALACAVAATLLAAMRGKAAVAVPDATRRHVEERAGEPVASETWAAIATGVTGGAAMPRVLSPAVTALLGGWARRVAPDLDSADVARRFVLATRAQPDGRRGRASG